MVVTVRCHRFQNKCLKRSIVKPANRIISGCFIRKVTVVIGLTLRSAFMEKVRSSTTKLLFTCHTCEIA